MRSKETVEFTNMCMVYDGDKVLVQDRVKGSWTGIAFPGGHVEQGDGGARLSRDRVAMPPYGRLLRRDRRGNVQEDQGAHGAVARRLFFRKQNKVESRSYPRGAPTASGGKAVCGHG